MGVITLAGFKAEMTGDKGSADSGFTACSMEGNTSFEALLQMGSTSTFGSTQGAPLYEMTLERYTPGSGNPQVNTLWWNAQLNNTFTMATFSNYGGVTLSVDTENTYSFSMSGSLSSYSYSIDAEGAMVESIGVVSTGVSTITNGTPVQYAGDGTELTLSQGSAYTPLRRGDPYLNYSSVVSEYGTPPNTALLKSRNQCPTISLSANLSLNIQPILCLGQVAAYDTVPQYPAEISVESTSYIDPASEGNYSVGGGWNSKIGPYSASVSVTSYSEENGGADGGPRTASSTGVGYNNLSSYY